MTFSELPDDPSDKQIRSFWKKNKIFKKSGGVPDQSSDKQRVEEWLDCLECHNGWMGLMKDTICTQCGCGPLCEDCYSIRNHDPCMKQFY